MIASSLFHFTRDIDTLLLILGQGRLRASYNIEEISDYYPTEKFAAIPMVCFCDVPLKFISEHPMVYGKFGIGLRKEWGLKLRVNPVLYRSTEGEIGESFNAIIKSGQHSITALQSRTALTPDDLTILGEIVKQHDKTFKLSAFSKIYRSKNVINYLDREWRFVPETAEIPLLRNNRKLDRHRINERYFSRSPDFLYFKPGDIKHIVVPNKREVSRLIAAITSFPFTQNVKARLTQMIIDLQSIKKDF